MTFPSGNAAQTPDSRAAGGLASVLKGLAGSRLVRSPPPPSSSSSPIASHAAPAADSTISLTPPNPNCLSPAHMEFFENLRDETHSNDRIEAASSLRYAIADYSPGCVRFRINFESNEKNADILFRSWEFGRLAKT